MVFERVYNAQLSQASYLIACDHAKVAVVVDPNRDADRYIQAAASHGVRITHVVETHIHADFVSGARELAHRTGARLYLSDAGGPEWTYDYAQSAHAELLGGGSTFEVGDVRVEAVHTPGHTPEHLTLMVTDAAAGRAVVGALTGDFIFVGEVGRPDLLERAAGVAGTMESAARALFRALGEFKRFPDYVQIWPGHGAGSACGKSLGAMPQSTLGYEKLVNWAFLELDEDRFVERVLAGQPEPPAYFTTMKRINRQGPAILSGGGAPRPLDPRELAAALEAGHPVVDTRGASSFAEGHANGSISIPRNKSFLTWAGSLLPYDRELFLIAQGGRAAHTDLSKELSLIGLERIAGVFPASSLNELTENGINIRATPQLTVAELATRLDTPVILDVRGKDEWNSGHIPGAINIPLGALQSCIADIPQGSVAVHCQGGGRSAIAASILQKHGRSDVANLTGGYAEWSRTGHPVERPAAEDVQRQ